MVRMFEALSRKDAIDEDIAGFHERIRLVVGTMKCRDPFTGKNSTHFVLVQSDGSVEVAPLRRSANKTRGYHFTVLRLVSIAANHSQDFKRLHLGSQMILALHH